MEGDEDRHVHSVPCPSAAQSLNFLGMKAPRSVGGICLFEGESSKHKLLGRVLRAPRGAPGSQPIDGAG